MKKLILILFALTFTAFSQQLLDSANVKIFDNTSDGNTGTSGTFMNDPTYREFPQSQNLGTDFYGWWTSSSQFYYQGGNTRRASRYGSGNNAGAHAQFYCTVHQSDYYLVYHNFYSGNSTTNAYVTFQRFGEGSIADSVRYNMLVSNNINYDIRKNGVLVESQKSSWFPLGIIELYAADSSLTVEIGLDSTGANTLYADAITLLRSTATGPDLEFGNRRFHNLTIDPATQDTLINYSFYKDRAPLEFAQTTFKWNRFTDRQLVLYNLGSAPLTVTGFNTNTNRFSVTTTAPIIIPVGGKYPITVRFSPKGEETTLDTLFISSNDEMEPVAYIPLIGTGINYNFILNASLNGAEPHWNAPTGSTCDLLGEGWIASTVTPYPYPITGGNIKSVVNTGSNNQISVTYGFTLADTLFGSYFLEHAGPTFSPNAAQMVTVDVVTPFYSNPNPTLGDTQRVLGFNSRLSTNAKPFVRIGGNTVFQLNGGGPSKVRFTNPSQGGTELLRADLLRIRLVPIAPTVSTSLDPARLLNFGSVSIYDSIRQIQFNFQRNFEIGSNGETPLQIDSIWIKSGTHFTIHNMPNFPIVLPAIDGKYNLLVSFLPEQITSYTDSIFIKTNDPVDSLVRIGFSGQGVGTGIVVDDMDPTNFIFPSDVIEWTGTPDPNNMDKWYRVNGSGTNNTRMFTYIYFNPANGQEKVEWYPYFPFKPGSTSNEIDTFDVYVQTAPGSAISSPRAKYVINHVGPNSPEIKIFNQNATSVGGNVGADGRLFLGRYQFLRGGQDFHNSGTVFGSVEVHNDTALVSEFYLDSAINRARQDSFVLRADAIIFEQAGATSVTVEPNMIPDEFALSQNFPNPFNPTTQIKFALPVDSKVDLKVYDILGREVATILSADLKAGYYTQEWNGKNDFGVQVSSGIYIYRIIAGKFVQTKKMMMLK